MHLVSIYQIELFHFLTRPSRPTHPPSIRTRQGLGERMTNSWWTLDERDKWQTHANWTPDERQIVALTNWGDFIVCQKKSIQYVHCNLKVMTSQYMFKFHLHYAILCPIQSCIIMGEWVGCKFLLISLSIWVPCNVTLIMMTSRKGITFLPFHSQ